MSSRQPQSERTSEPTAWSMLATRLKEERERHGLSLGELAEKVRYDRAVLHKMERGLVLGSEYITGRLEELYGTGDTLHTLRTLAKSEARRNKYQSYMDLEANASCLHEYAGGTIPGLLQTEAYAREQVSTSPASQEALEELVTERLARRERLMADDGMIYRAILDEAVLLRRMSDKQAWHEQLEHLLMMSQRPNVTLQVVPIAVGIHDFVGGNVFLLWHPGGENNAYVESSKVGDLVENPEYVAELRLSYDHIRDLSLSPGETRHFLQHLMEEERNGREPSRPGRPRLEEVVVQRRGRRELPGDI